MERLFRFLLEQSLTACWVIPVVLLVRFLLRKAPKRITNLLWIVVAFRLVCPVSFESDISLVTQAQNVSQAAAELADELRERSWSASESQPTVTLPEPTLPSPVPAIPEDTAPAPTVPVLPDVIVTPELPGTDVTVTVTPNVTEPTVTVTDYKALFDSVGSALWLAGMAALLLYGFAATRQWRRRVRTAVRGEDGIWRSEAVETPFILGIFRPRIYLPFVLPQGAESHVIAHEQAHLRRHDPLLKFLAFLLLCVYWFHPLVWVSYFLFCRDIELACDQQVTRTLDAEGKKAYSRALLACTAERADPILCPLSFGEVGVKARIKNVLQKQPGRVFSIAALVLCTALIIACAADPRSPEEPEKMDEESAAELQKRYAEYLESQIRSRKNNGRNAQLGFAALVDFSYDGVPELVYCFDDTVTMLHPRGEDFSAVSWTVGNRQNEGGLPYFLLDLSLEKPSLTVFDGSGTSESAYIFTRVGEVVQLESMYANDLSYDRTDHWRGPGYEAEYDAAIMELAKGAEIITPYSAANTAAAKDFLSLLKKGKAPLYGAQQDYLVYAGTLRELMAAHGAYVPDDRTDMVLGLKYAALVDFERDARPELVTLVNTRDADTGALAFTLSVRQVKGGKAELLYTTDLGGRYGQTDVSYCFDIGWDKDGRPRLLTYHTENEWTHERVRCTGISGGEPETLTFEAGRPDGEDFPTREGLTDFSIDGQAVNRDGYEEALQAVQAEHYCVDVCWAGATGSRTELEQLLNALGVDFAPAWPESVESGDPQSAYLAVLDAIGAAYDWQRTLEDGTEHSGIRNIALIDFEQDATPELLVQKDKTLLLYGWDGSAAQLLWQEAFATEAFYINETLSLPRLVVNEKSAIPDRAKTTVLKVEGNCAVTDVLLYENTFSRFYYINGSQVLQGRYITEYERAMEGFSPAEATIQEMSALVRRLGEGTAFAPAGTLLWEDGENRLLWQKQRSGTCLLGDWECADCFTSDLILVQGRAVTTLLENVPLAAGFEALIHDSDPGRVYVSYRIGPAHSEYDHKAYCYVDLNERTLTDYRVESLYNANSVTAVYLQPQAEETALLRAMLEAAPEGRIPQPWLDVADSYRYDLALQFADGQIWELYFNENTVAAKTIYARETLSGQVRVLPELFWDTASLLWDYWELSPDRMVHQPRNFTLTLNGETVKTEDAFARFSLRWADDVPTLMVDVLAAARLLGVEMVQESNGLRAFPAGMESYLGFSDHLVTVFCGGETFRTETYCKPACDDGVWYVPIHALEELLGVGITYWVENLGYTNEHWTLDLYDMEHLVAMAKDGAKAVGGSYTPTGDMMQDRHLTKWEAVMDMGGGQALLWFNPDNSAPSNMLGPVLHKLSILDYGYIRSYTSGGKTTQSLYSQPYSVETLPLEYEEIACVDSQLGLYSLKQNGKYGMAWIPLGKHEVRLLTDCKWGAPLTLAEMCAKVAGGEDAVPVELPSYSPPAIDNSVKLLDGVLTWKGQRYPLPDWETAKSAGANGDSLEIVGDRVLVTVHINPWNSYNAIFNLETCTFESQFYGVALGWHQKNLTTLVYDSWGSLYTLDGQELGRYAEDETAFRGSRVEECVFSEDGKQVTLTVVDLEETSRTFVFDL